MIYPWQDSVHLQFLGLPTRCISLEVLDQEHYDDQDSPEKRCFNGRWDNWQGVTVKYQAKSERCAIIGSRGKTVWYVPALTPRSADSLGIPIGHALKILKYPLSARPKHEVQRLKYELLIQQTLNKCGLAPRVYNVLVIRNDVDNRVMWFDHSYEHPAGSLYLATEVEHVSADRFPTNQIHLGDKWDFSGTLVDGLVARCCAVGIAPYDLVLGNLTYSKGDVKVLDFHRWQFMRPPWIGGRLLREVK